MKIKHFIGWFIVSLPALLILAMMVEVHGFLVVIEIVGLCILALGLLAFGMFLIFSK